MMDMALRTAAQTFFRRSRAWQQWLTAITVATGDREYTIPLPDGAQVLQLDRATADGAPLAVLSWRSFVADAEETPGCDQGVTTRDRTSIVLAREMPAGTLLKLRATLLPTDAATGIPDDQFALYRQAIARGAQSQLQSTRDKPYTDVAMASIAEGQFQDAIGAAGIAIYRGNTSTSPRVRPEWC